MNKKELEALRATIWTAAKSGLRTALLAIVSYISVQTVISGLLDWCCKAFMSPEVIVIATGFILTILKGFDKWLHEWGVETDNDALKTGLTRF